MVLESTIVCVDNSDYMRNGDFLPSRLHAQQEAVNLVCQSKTRANPENNVGLVTIASTAQVLVTLTTDIGKLLARLQQVQPKGNITFVSAVRIAHLVLKHRQGKNHKMRIVVFVGSPIEDDEKELVKLAKRLRKEKVNVDVINFGEEATNTEKLTTFVNNLNGSDGSGSHLVTVSAGPLLSDALISSPVIIGEDGAGAVPVGGFEFGVDPNDDPELALALRVSMEEQRARQEEEARRSADTPGVGNEKIVEESLDDQMLRQALEMSKGNEAAAAASNRPAPQRDVSDLSEEEQMALALQMSLQSNEEGMDVSEDKQTAAASKVEGMEEEDYSEVTSDPEFLQSVLEKLPGVDPQDAAVRQAVEQLTKQPSNSSAKSDEKEKKKKDDKEKQ